MDVDWCLTCAKHLDMPGPYCSPACAFIVPPSLSESDDDDSIYHPIHDTTGGNRIAAWIAGVPLGAPPESPESSTAHRPPPRLVPERRPIPPSLSMSKPVRPTCTSLPHHSPQQQLSVYSDMLASSATDSSVATPPIVTHSHKPSVFSTLASQVRSLVVPPKRHHHDLTSSLHFRSSSFSSQDSFQADDDDVSDDLWWMTESPTLKKSSAQSITKAKDESTAHNYFQPKHLPIPPSHSSQRSEEPYQSAYRHRGRKLSRPIS